MTTSRATPAARRRLRLLFAVWLGRCAGWASRLIGSGQGRTVPGRVALAVMPDALAVLSAPHRVVLVSGTNGKTTTTLLLSRALSCLGPVISNSDGANLSSGLVSALLAARRRGPAIAVLEVDEVALVDALGRFSPEVLVLLNLSRDQLDRTSEVRDHVRAWTAALAGAPQTLVVANADDALVVAAVLGARPQGRDVVWVWARKFFRGDSAVCPVCGCPWDATARDWHCASCGLRRPRAGWKLDDPRAMTVDGQEFSLDLRLPGRANASNAVMAAAAASAMGVPVETALAGMRSVEDIEGRYGRTTIAGRDVRLLLAKNPAGWLEALEQLQDSDRAVVVAINAQDADGNDPSWLWDVPMDQLQGRLVIATGERAWDLAVRLTYAGVDHQVATDVRAALDLVPAGGCDVVANYTAFVAARFDLFTDS